MPVARINNRIPPLRQTRAQFVQPPTIASQWHYVTPAVAVGASFTIGLLLLDILCTHCHNISHPNKLRNTEFIPIYEERIKNAAILGAVSLPISVVHTLARSTYIAAREGFPAGRKAFSDSIKSELWKPEAIIKNTITGLALTPIMIGAAIWQAVKQC